MVKLIDTHSHIFVDDFEDKKSIINQAKIAGLQYILMPNIDVASIDQVNGLAEQFPNIAIPMMGLHPSSVEENYKSQLNTIYQSFSTRKYFGVGEIGLDFYWTLEFKNEQLEVLETQLQWAVDMNLPVSLHTREATQETIEICKNFPGLTGVFHCFGGTPEQAHDIVDMGMYLGIGGVLTFKNARLGETISSVPLGRLVLETDAPYLAPHPYRGKQNSPALLPIIASKLAEVKNVEESEVWKITSDNAKRIFKL